MPTFVDRDETVDLLRREYASLSLLGATLGAEQWSTPTCLPGWTVHDVFGHVIGTETMMTGQPPPDIDIGHLGPLRNPVAETNERWVESMRPLSGPELLARFDEVTARRLEQLDAMTQADFVAPSWTPAGRDETYGRFMRIRHYDCFMHEHDIRSAVGAPPRPDVADLVSALDEVETGLGYIVGRRAALPDGSSVQIDLHGPLTRTYLVSVDGWASVVDTLEGPPTVTVSMPVLLFLRLTGGRADGQSERDATSSITGDRGLGAQLVDNLAFTI
jgi:uncharacterized protein (TIGR03083 family)